MKELAITGIVSMYLILIAIQYLIYYLFNKSDSESKGELESLLITVSIIGFTSLPFLILEVFGK